MVRQRDEEHSLLVDSVLVTVGRKPNTQGWGLEEMGFRMNDSQDSSLLTINVKQICRFYDW